MSLLLYVPHWIHKINFWLAHQPKIFLKNTTREKFALEREMDKIPQIAKLDSRQEKEVKKEAVKVIDTKNKK